MTSIMSKTFLQSIIWGYSRGEKVYLEKLYHVSDTYIFIKEKNYFSSDSSEEQKSLKLSLMYLITFLSTYLHSFENTCR